MSKWKFQQFKPPKARGKLLDSMWTDPHWIVERKYDGDRRIAQFCAADGAVRFTGTRESVDGTGFVEKTANVPHLSDFGDNAYVSKIRVLDGTVLDGEVVVPDYVCGVCLNGAHEKRDKHPEDTHCFCPCRGGLSKFVTAVMGSKPERAVQLQQERGWLQYVVFDCLFYKGQDLRGKTLETRQAYAEMAVARWDNPHARLVGKTETRSGSKRAFYEWLVKQGHEGVILKDLCGLYGDESAWVKVKREATADVVVMGFKAGKNKNAGMVGAVEFGQYVKTKAGLYLQACGSARGFDDDLMVEMTAHPRKFLGRVMEIKHNGREPTGAFRHPRFSRWRPDKNANECIWREDET